MAKIDQEAFSKILELVNSGAIVQFEKRGNGYEVTVWPDALQKEHSHHQGETLIETVMKIPV